MQGEAGKNLVTMCDGCPALASIAGALLRKCERKKLSKTVRRQSPDDCDDLVTKNLQAEGCSTWQQVTEKFLTKVGNEMCSPAFVNGSYSNVANAYSMLVGPLLERHVQDKKRVDQMAAMLEYFSTSLLFLLALMSL